MKRVREPSPAEPPPETPLPGPFLSPNGTVLLVPHALTSGRPKAEPAERWTLGSPDSDWPAGKAAPANDAPAPIPVPVAPVRRGRRAR